MHNEVNVVCISANTTSMLQPMNRGVILTFTPYYFRNTFHKALAARESDSCDGSGMVH